MRLALLALLGLVLARPAGAATLAGVTMPETRRVDGQTLILNGMALRTYSLLAIRIYVGGLYLRAPTHDGAAVLAETGPRLIALHFLHDVPATKARSVWAEQIHAVCDGRCMPSPASLKDFLGRLRDVRQGNDVDFLFTATGLETAMNGQPSGATNDPVLAHAILEVFLGARAPTPAVRKGLLGE